MSLLERGMSSGDLSVGALLDGDPAPAQSRAMEVREVIAALAIGGWPDNLGLTVVMRSMRTPTIST